MVRLTKAEKKKQEEEEYRIEKEKFLDEFPWNFINLLLQFEEWDIIYTLHQEQETNNVNLRITNEIYRCSFPLEDIKNHTISDSDYTNLLWDLDSLDEIVKSVREKKKEEIRIYNLKLQALSKLTDAEKLALNLK